MPGKTFGEEYFSEIFNQQLASLSSIARPVSRVISHIMLSNCDDVKVILDLNRVDRDASDLTDISFENIENLSVRFEQLNHARIFVFTNIISNKLSGRMPERSSSVKMYFRQQNPKKKEQTSVAFQNIDIQSNIRLLNIQDIGEVRVVDSNFRNIDTLEIVHPTKCYTSMDTFRDSEVACTKDALFFASRYSSTR